MNRALAPRTAAQGPPCVNNRGDARDAVGYARRARRARRGRGSRPGLRNEGTPRARPANTRCARGAALYASNTGWTARTRLAPYRIRPKFYFFQSTWQCAEARAALLRTCVAAPMASLKLLLQALQTSGGLAPLVVALVAVLALHLLMRGGRAPARPRGPVTLSPGVKARLQPPAFRRPRAQLFKRAGGAAAREPHRAVARHAPLPLRTAGAYGRYDGAGIV